MYLKKKVLYCHLLLHLSELSNSGFGPINQMSQAHSKHIITVYLVKFIQDTSTNRPFIQSIIITANEGAAFGLLALISRINTSCPQRSRNINLIIFKYEFQVWNCLATYVTRSMIWVLLYQYNSMVFLIDFYLHVCPKIDSFKLRMRWITGDLVVHRE